MAHRMERSAQRTKIVSQEGRESDRAQDRRKRKAPQTVEKLERWGQCLARRRAGSWTKLRIGADGRLCYIGANYTTSVWVEGARLKKRSKGKTMIASDVNKSCKKIRLPRASGVLRRERDRFSQTAYDPN